MYWYFNLHNKNAWTWQISSICACIFSVEGLFVAATFESFIWIVNLTESSVNLADWDPLWLHSQFLYGSLQFLKGFV